MQEERNGITLTILQEKGGCGKSCAIFNIADYLSKKKNVLIIDLDGQAADISYFLFGNKVGDSQDPMRSDVKTIMHIFRGADPEDVIVPVKSNLDIVPANTEVTGLMSIHKIKIFKDFIRQMRAIYDYILIDEGQDFRGDWIRFLEKFYTKKGELFIVYDKAQDLYEHGIWIEDSQETKNIGFRGQPGSLKYSYRMPKEIIEKIGLIRKELGIVGEDILIPKNNSTQISLLSKMEWINCDINSEDDKLNKINSKIKELRENNQLEDITILTTNENTGVDIVKFFMNKGIKVSHVYDMNKKKNEKNRRNEKWKFRGGTGRLKICSYHSYKGWQTPNIILVLDSCGSENIVDIRKNVGNAIFISMSRVKPNSMNGQFSFKCFNYLPEYNFLEKLF